MSQAWPRSIGIIAMCIMLGGCALVAAGGAATGAAVMIDRRTTATMLEDQAIELKAARELNADEELNEKAHINVTSYNTVALLTGEAPTEELRSRAVEIVRNVPKVSKVYNEIAIAAPSSLMSRSSDSVITTKVKTALFAQDGIDATQIKVVTERGIVYLIGLASEEEQRIATEAARRVGGVQKVVKLFQPYQSS